MHLQPNRKKVRAHRGGTDTHLLHSHACPLAADTTGTS